MGRTARELASYISAKRHILAGGEEPGILLFDVSKNAANFDLVIQALVTNDLSLDDEIVLAFERLLREKLKDEWLVIAAANPTRKVNFKLYC